MRAARRSFNNLIVRSVASRKAVTDEPLVRVQLKLAESDRDWLKARGEISRQIRALINQARQAEEMR